MTHLTTGQFYALATLVIVGTMVCFIGILDTIVLVSTGHDSEALSVLLRFIVGLFGASGVASAIAIGKHISEVQNGETPK